MVIKKKYFDIILLAITSLLIILIPWEAIRKRLFVDKQGYIYYLTYFKNRTLGLEINSPIDYITNESLWHFFIFFLKDNLSLRPEIIFLLISFFCLFSASLILYNYSRKTYSIFFLLNPIFIDFYSSQLRLAFAFTLWCWAYLLYRNHKLIAYSLAVISVFIHTSSVLFIATGLLALYLSGRDTKYQNLKIIFSIITGILISLMSGPFRYEILSMIGDRRAEYKEISYNILFHSFWALLILNLFINIFRVKFRLRDIHYYAIIFLTLVLLNYFIGGYSSRYLAATFPFLVAVIFYQRAINRILLIICYVLYTLVYFSSWL